MLAAEHLRFFCYTCCRSLWNYYCHEIIFFDDCLVSKTSHKNEPRHDKMCLWEFPTRPETNWPAQPQKLASLEISAIESRDIILSKQRTTKALIRLHGCAGWSAPLLFTYDIRHIFSWPSSNKCCISFSLNVYLYIFAFGTFGRFESKFLNSLLP